MKKSELKEFIKSEIINELEVKTPLREGNWSVVPERIPEFLRALKQLKDDYYEIVGSDDVFDGLDRAESAAEELLMLDEASEEEVQNQQDLNKELEITAKLSKELSEGEDEEVFNPDAKVKKNKGFNKAKDELALLTQEMKSLARKYSKAEGEEKEKLVKTLKAKTKLKKELESILSKKKI